MRDLIISILFVFFVTGSSAQSGLDSLVSLASKLMMTDRDAYYSVSDELIALAKTENNDTVLIEGYMTRAMVHFLSRNYPEALAFYDSVQKTAPSDSRDYLEALIGATDIYPKLNYPDSFINHKHLTIIQQILPVNDSMLIASEYANYGNYLVDKARYHEGIHYLILSIDFTPRKLTYKRVLNIFKLAKLFFYIQDFEKAGFYSDQAMAISKSYNYKIKDKFLASLAGRIAVQEGKYAQADSLLQTALSNFKKNRENTDVFKTYLYLAELELKRNEVMRGGQYLDSASFYKSHAKEKYNLGKYHLLQAANHLSNNRPAKADSHLDSIELINDEIQNIFLSSEYFFLRSKQAENNQNYRQSLGYYQQYKMVQDSLFQFNTTGKIYDLESKYQNSEKLKEIELLTTKNELISVKLDHERWLKRTILIFAVIILTFLVFLAYTYYRVRGKNQLIRKTVTQKELLLKEIHHRVKNNLQLISSLLNLQSRYIKDEKARQVSMEGKTRVRAMSLIHQFLYQKDDLMHLSLDEYFNKLVKELLEIYDRSPENVNVNCRIEHIELDVDRVIPLGLIFNELMTNILKYAFPENTKGNVDVNLYHENENLILRVEDDGSGFNAETMDSKEESFGFTLIEALLSKWKGILQVDSDNGTKVRISIPKAVN